MNCRSYFVHLKPEDFKFVKPETKKTSQKDNVYSDKVKEIKEEKEKEAELEERHSYVLEYHHDYDDGGSEEVQIDRRDSEAYKPLVSEIDEWLQAVEALSSRATLCSGRLFGDLDPVPFIDEVDPAPGACFNCRQAGHRSRECAEARTAFCINCGRRGESVVNCPRCSRQQYQFFARRREEERRRAASVCREGAPSAIRTTSPGRAGGGRSRSVGRQGTKAAEGSDWRAEVQARTNKASRSRRETVSRDRREDSQSQVAGVAEKPIVARNFPRDPTPARLEGPKDHRGGKEPDEVPDSERRPRRRRIRRRRRRRDRRENPQGINPALQEQSEEERRRNNKAIREPADNGFAARVERERPISTVVECRREVVAARTETRRVEERQPTAEDHVAKREQRAALHWAEESRRACENSFIMLFKEEKPNELGIKPKKRSEEEKIPINLDDEYLKLLERMNRQLSAQFCKLVESMQLSRPKVTRILVLLNEIQHYDTLKQELIILDELLLEICEKKWWKISEIKEAKF